MSAEEDAADLSVYDLAERMAAGQQLTIAAQREVATELLALRKRTGEILDSVNAALNRAGIHCSISFADAIDRIAGERDRLVAAARRG